MERESERRDRGFDPPGGRYPFEPTQEFPAESAIDDVGADRTIELREERLVPSKEMIEVGEIVIRKEIEEVSGRLELDAYSEDVEIEHVPVGQAVSEKVAPWEEGGALVVPVYEEQLVVSKRLVMKEKLVVRRVGATERRLFTDTLRRERLVVEDPNNTGLVHEHLTSEHSEDAGDERANEHGGILQNIVRRALS